LSAVDAEAIVVEWQRLAFNATRQSRGLDEQQTRAMESHLPLHAQDESKKMRGRGGGMERRLWGRAGVKRRDMGMECEIIHI
jgi:hypothetical protein